MKYQVYPSIMTQFSSAPKSYSYLTLLITAALIILVGNASGDIYPLVTASGAFIFFCGLVYLISAKAMFSVSAGSLLGLC